ncbi:microtubule nucleation [Trichomonas vaginalis G3]|uniref:microtubule nucleation n=1 Tax=Trichomonas vaginalis (strain ATCC PRA-98 / G3) TaxID=412133 RepID=UPI0021E5C312|nr:microtubule nucleation [Trichomonas vaginalis G3]KAI5482051.1 microtubule nucleation [Trichomonas vaginalis G3]
MSKKIITIQVGQCGNSIGLEFWKTLSTEHGIGPDGVLREPENTLEDRKDIFFYSSDDGRYIPRAILIDLEPRVIMGIKNSELKDFFNAENMYIGVEGSGAGNVWGTGYAEGEAHYEAFSEIVRREVEVADALEGFIFTHSISGGTGSGLGSFLIEKLSDEYKKATTISYSVFPGEEDKDVVVAPYNSILTLKRLTNNCDAVVVLDNTALGAITNPVTPGGVSKKRTEGGKTENSFREMNMLVSNVMAATTATLRFPAYSNNDLVSLLAPLVPTPKSYRLYLYVNATQQIQQVF